MNVYFVSNNKKPNLLFFLTNKGHLFSSRQEARVKLQAVKAIADNPKTYKIFKVSTTTVR